MKNQPWLENSMPFINYMDNWLDSLSSMPLKNAASDPTATAIASVDVIKGFCDEGSLASPRIKALVPPVTDLLTKAWQIGIKNIILLQDSHEPDAIEFEHFGPHCVRGTKEAEPVAELIALPFFAEITLIEKNSIHSGIGTGLNPWLKAHDQITTFIVVGDCTDLCTYQLAMHLRLDANAHQLQRRVILPVNCVATYDLPVTVAQEIGAIPHDAELLQRVFLYSMMLNGVEICRNLT